MGTLWRGKPSETCGEAFYKRKEIFELCQIHVATSGKASVRLDAFEDLVEDPVQHSWLAELDEFLGIIQDTLQATSAVYPKDLKAFKPHPRESLLKLSDRPDEVAMPLLFAGVMMSTNLALNIRKLIPTHI